MADKFNFRCVQINGNTYLRKEDIASFLREIGGTEETDVRNRLELAAAHIERMGDDLDKGNTD